MLARFVTRSRIGAALGSASLALSYTFWSQAIIAEVYVPATAFLVVIMVLLAYWQRDPFAHRRALFFATVLTCLGLGIHASVVLIAPTAVLFVLWVLWSQRVAQWRRCLSAASVGFAVGLSFYFLTFILLDFHNPTSSFVQVMLYPSRSIWGLQASDLDSVFERWWLTVSGVQWQDAMFPEGYDLIEALGYYLDRIQNQEFSLWMLIFALFGFRVMRRSAPRLCVFLLATFVVILAFVVLVKMILQSRIEELDTDFHG